MSPGDEDWVPQDDDDNIVSPGLDLATGTPLPSPREDHSDNAFDQDGPSRELSRLAAHGRHQARREAGSGDDETTSSTGRGRRNRLDDDTEDDADAPATPVVCVSPLSIGRSDRYGLLNVHNEKADSAARTYSHLSRRGGDVDPSEVVPVIALCESPEGGSPRTARHSTSYIDRLRSSFIVRRENPYPIAFGWDLFPTFLLNFVAMLLLAVMEVYLVKQHFSASLGLFLPSFGSSAGILFGLPKSPFAQPRNFFFGHVVGALVGVSITQATRAAIEQEPLSSLVAGSLAVSITMGLMMFMNLMHPSACATAVSAAAVQFLSSPEDRGYLFILTPVLLGCVVLFLVSWLGNNLFAARAPYPMYW